MAERNLWNELGALPNKRFMALKGFSRPGLIYEKGDGIRRMHFENEHCRFLPVGWIEIAGETYPLMYQINCDNLTQLNSKRDVNTQRCLIDKWSMSSGARAKNSDIWVTGTREKVDKVRADFEDSGLEVQIFLAGVYKPTSVLDDGIVCEGTILLERV